MLASLQLSGEGRKGSLAWDPASLLDPRVSVCVCVWGGGWEGVAESKGGSKLNVLQRTGGPNGPIFSLLFESNTFYLPPSSIQRPPTLSHPPPRPETPSLLGFGS